MVFLGLIAVTTSLVDVVFYLFPVLKSYGVGIHHLSVYLHCTVVQRHNKAVTLAQHQVGIAAGFGKCLFQFNTYGIGFGNLVLVVVGRHLEVGSGASALQGLCYQNLLFLFTLHLCHLFHALTFHLCHLSQQASSFDVCHVGHSASSFYQVTQAFVFLRQGVCATEEHLAFNGYVLLLLISRTLAYIYLIEGHQCKGAVAVYLVVLAESEGEHVGQCVGRGGCVVDNNASSHIHFHQ